MLNQDSDFDFSHNVADHLGFSWHPCDQCSDPNGGDRFLIPNSTPLPSIHRTLAVCQTCYLKHYGVYEPPIADEPVSQIADEPDRHNVAQPI